MNLACYSYKLPFATPLQTSSQTFNYRKGFILHLTNTNQKWYAEVAPLPGYSTEFFDEVKSLLGTYRNDFQQLLSKGDLNDLNNFYQDKNIPPSLQFGIDSLAYQLKAYQQDNTLSSMLFPEAPDKIAVNALLSFQHDAPFERLKHLTSEGYGTIKCKIGLNFEREYELLQRIRKQYPKLTIRVDANKAWTLEEAIANGQKLHELNIEYCEELLQDPTPENMERLSNQTPLPIALDESISQHSYWPNLLPYTQYLILKPMLIGNFQKNIETKRLANTHNNTVVVTTSLESSVGRHFINIMAAGLGSPQLAHGLSTGNVFSSDFFADNTFISKGTCDTTQPLPTITFDERYTSRIF